MNEGLSQYPFRSTITISPAGDALRCEPTLGEDGNEAICYLVGTRHIGLANARLGCAHDLFPHDVGPNRCTTCRGSHVEGGELADVVPLASHDNNSPDLTFHLRDADVIRVPDALKALVNPLPDVGIPLLKLHERLSDSIAITPSRVPDEQAGCGLNVGQFPNVVRFQAVPISGAIAINQLFPNRGHDLSLELLKAKEFLVLDAVT